MPIANSKKRRGTALLESIIAIGVILTGVVGTLVLLNTSINLGRANQDRIVAQNLAREGLELAYSLRNSASMRKVDDPTTNWYSYLQSEVLKSSDPDTYLSTYNLGDVVDRSGVPTCQQRCTTDNPAINCTTENNDQIKSGSALISSDAYDDSFERECDVLALANYLFEAPGTWPQIPPACTTPDKATFCTSGICMSNAPDNCDYDGQGGVDISDVTSLVYQFYLNSFQFGFGYPRISGVAGKVEGNFDFYNTIDANFADATGSLTSLDPVWADARARVYTDAPETTYVQNISDTSGYTQTKYYRVVTTQSICRGTKSGAVVELVIDSKSAFNCTDYVADNSGSGEVADGWDAGVVNVGLLVSSEVRWPTPTSSTKARYQEFLYDWIAL